MQDMFKKILLPISGSDESIEAAEFAVELAKAHDSQIIALYVVDNSVVRQLARHSGKSTSPTTWNKCASKGNVRAWTWV